VRDLIEEASERALSVLEGCVTPLGLKASAAPGGYDQVWTRDAVFVLLGICAARAEQFLPALRTTLETLTERQSELGYVPLNVDPAGRPSTSNAGSVDGNLLYVIGHETLHRTFGAADLIERHAEALERAMHWARCQDSDGDGLLESQEGADWADLLAYRGKVLYDNVLYVLALRAYAALGLPNAERYLALAEQATARLNALHWVEAPHGLWENAASPALHGEHAESRRLAELTSVQLWARPYYLPWLGFRDYGDWCDVFGNSLAVLAGVASDARAASILDHLDLIGAASPFPSKAMDPPLRPGDKDWRDYYRNGGLNLPHSYHNGGIWPLIGGFHVAALAHSGRDDDAQAALERLVLSVREGRHGEWEFNEWLHGTTGRPMGVPLQAWSASAVLLARAAVAGEGHVLP
jgi:glycogen debranching enzyme